MHCQPYLSLIPYQLWSFPSKYVFPIYVVQECERMNALTQEMKRSLRELDLGLKGELTITSDMEDLSNSLFFDQVLQICSLKCPAQNNL